MATANMMGNFNVDDPFRLLFPYHNNHTDKFLMNNGTYNGTAKQVYTKILNWATGILRDERSFLTLTRDLGKDLEDLVDSLRRILARGVHEVEKQSRRYRLTIEMTSQYWVEVKCQHSCKDFLNCLTNLEYDNIKARCYPYLILTPYWWWGTNYNNKIAPHVGHILREVRREISEYRHWKRMVQQGAAGDSPQQPPAFWNWILRDVSRYAREVAGREKLPDQYSVEKMIWILEETYLRQHSPQDASLFPGLDDLFSKLQEKEALRILVQGFWALERRWEGGCSDEHHNDMVRLVRRTVARRYGRIAVSATGMPIAAWRGHGDGDGNDVADENRIDIRLNQSKYMRFGLPDANVVSRTVHESFCDSDGNLDALQWHVDISWVRNHIVVDWGDLAKRQCQHPDSPPSYEELFGNAPKYERVFGSAPPYRQVPSQPAKPKEHADLALRFARVVNLNGRSVSRNAVARI